MIVRHAELECPLVPENDTLTALALPPPVPAFHVQSPAAYSLGGRGGAEWGRLENPEGGSPRAHPCEEGQAGSRLSPSYR